MRHVSRTHRVALDWLFDRINLDRKIQIKYINTKNQLADILTKVNFTRDEWNHLLTLLNISHFSSTACTAAMAKRAQQESGEERVTAKSRPMMIWPQERLRSCLLQPHQTRWRPRMDIKILKDLFQLTIERRNLRNRQHQVIQKRIIVDLGILKSGRKVELRSTIDQGNLRQLGIFCKKVAPHREEPLLDGNAHRDDSWWIGESWDSGSPRRGLFHKFSSWAVAQQNLWAKSKTKCETDSKECRTLQSQVKSIQ